MAIIGFFPKSFPENSSQRRKGGTNAFYIVNEIKVVYLIVFAFF